MIIGSKWSSKLNSAIGIVMVHLSIVKLVSRVGMYSSKDATSESGIVRFPSIISKIGHDYINKLSIRLKVGKYFLQ